MTLNHDDRLVRWTYLLRNEEYDFKTDSYQKFPSHTTLCRFFWRAFVFMPLFCIIVSGAAGIAVVGIGIFVWEELKIVSLVTGAVVAVAGVTFLLHLVSHTDWAKVSIRSVKSSAFIQGLKAVSGKFCPLIEIR